MAGAATYQGYSVRIREHLERAEMSPDGPARSAAASALQKAAREAIEALRELKNDTSFWNAVDSATAKRPARRVEETTQEVTRYLAAVLSQMGMRAPPPPSPEEFVEQMRRHLESAAKGKRPSVADARVYLDTALSRLQTLSERLPSTKENSGVAIWSALNKASIVITLAGAAAALNSCAPSASGAPTVNIEQNIIILQPPGPSPQPWPALHVMQEQLSATMLWAAKSAGSVPDGAA